MKDKYKLNTEDLCGKKFGAWTVLLPIYIPRKEKNYKTKKRLAWYCVCECGTFRNITTYELTHGKTKSCGCKNKLDLIGKKFERLIVIEEVFDQELLKRRKGHFRWWKCLCECGKITYAVTADLINGHVKSCGCMIHNGDHLDKIRIGYGEAVRNRIIGQYKKRAKKRGLAFELTDEEVIYMFLQDCFYCGCPPSNIAKHPYSYGEFVYNGIDRIDNTKGYIKENVVTACRRCNEKKAALTYEEFTEWIKRIAINLKLI